MTFEKYNSSSVLDAALFYFSQGLQPVLIREKEKRPFEDKWNEKEYKNAEEIRAAFKNHKGNIGIRGNIDGLIGIDCDDARFRDALLRALPMLADTLHSKGKKDTGHYWVRLTKPLKNQSVRLHLSDKTKTTFADLRGIGGQIVVAPSIHPEGAKYQWLNSNPILPLDTDVFLEALDTACAAVGCKNPYRNEERPRPKIDIQTTNLFAVVKEQVRLSDVLPSGSDRVNCIFHKEETPSAAMRLYPKSNSAYCFSCGKAADVISIYAQQHHIGQFEAAKELAQKYCPEALILNSGSMNSGSAVLKSENQENIHNTPQSMNSYRHTTEVGGSQKLPPTAKLPPQTSPIQFPDVKQGVTAIPPNSAKPVVSHLPPTANAIYGGGWGMADGGKQLAGHVVPTKLRNFKPLNPKAWIVKDILGAGTLAVLGGKRATFKSTISVSLAARVAAGLPFLGHHCEKVPVLYMDEENGDAHLYDLFTGTIKPLGAEFEPSCLDNVQIICGQGVSHLWATMASFEPDAPDCPKLIILDGLRRFLGAANENDAGEVSQFMQTAKYEAERLGACILFLHHARKSQNGGAQKADEFEDAMDSLRGSSDIMASVSTAMITTRVGDSTKVMVSFPKTRWGKEPEPVGIEFDMIEGSIQMNMTGENNQCDFVMTQNAQLIRDWAVKGLHDTFSTDMVKNGMAGRLGVRTIERVLPWMIDAGWVRKRGRGSYEIDLPAAGQQQIG